MMKYYSLYNSFLRTLHRNLFVLTAGFFCIFLLAQPAWSANQPYMGGEQDYKNPSSENRQGQAPLQMASAGVRSSKSLSCKLSARTLQSSECHHLEHLKKFIGKCGEQLSNEYISAQKAQLTKLESKCGAPVTAGVCNFDAQIVEIEKRSEASTVFAEHLRKLLRLELPTYPPLAFSVTTSDKDISMTIDDPKSFSQWVANTSDSVNTLVGSFADLPPGVPSLSDMLPLIGHERNMSKLSSAMTTSLSLVSGWIQDYKKTGSNNQEGGIPQFLIDQGQTLQNVTKVRNRMICYVKLSLPKYFKEYDELTAYQEKTKSDIASNKACEANDASKAKSYNKLIALKLKAARKPYDWINNSSLGAKRNGAQSNWEQRNIWADSGFKGGSPNILAETDCSTFSK